MKKEKITGENIKKMEELHRAVQQWKSQLHFIVDESLFFSHLLDSNIFKPNILNLFENLQNYKYRLKKKRDTEEELRTDISIHESNLSNIMEHMDDESNLDYYLKHDRLQNKVCNYFEDFQKLKSEIFNYVAGVLKKHRP